jgi:5-formyltetrahydrofolate cyclo-ligase
VAKEKEHLRKIFAKIRDNQPEEQRRRKSSLIGRRLFGLDEFKESRTVMFFATFRSEVDTMPMIRKTLRMGKKVALPLVRGRSISAVEVDNVEKCVAPGAFNIPEPVYGKGRIKPESIDLVLIPGLVFDRSGHRIGYGGGYYDRWLKYFEPCKRVSLAFYSQVMKKIPHTGTDLSVNKIVTEKGVISARGKRS